MRAPLPVLVLLACAACSAVPGQSEELRWFESGWYVGATGGTAKTDASASDLDQRLAERGFTTSSTLDDEDSAWKAFLGYRFERYFGFEVGYVNLGEIASEVDTMLIDPNVLVNALADTQPYLGQGPSLALVFYALDSKRVDVGLRGGAWYWDADVEATATTGESVEISEENVDPFWGAFVLVEINERAQLRLEYERYTLDDDDADFISGGIQIRLN